MILQGNNIELLKTLEDNSVDSIVTDPPYGLSFMNKKWDYDVPSVELWKEVLRVLKPGGHLLSFGGSRTYHRMAVAIEDAGFEVRDQIMWVYGSGFPKSLNIGKAVDKIQGNEREVVGDNPNHRKLQETNSMVGEPHSGDGIITKGQSDWEGWGTALKPAHEPICMARKPLSEKTIAENVLKHGTGGINIDDCRIGSEETTEGRFPANIMFDEEAGKILGEPSRFFYCPKVSKKERDMGLDDMEDRPSQLNSGGIDRKTSVEKRLETNGENAPTTKNHHPTVKPIKLMEYLIKLVTPKGGTVLDPFMGSGSTGVAAKLNGFNFIGMEMDEDYFKIAESRINNYEEYGKI